ncbi:MAG: DUF3617 family protein [Sphingomonas sp.]|uniref:DUF3617 domain-containing protein n=1 Tax=Sphingomonas sp. TaxID=28214 RepID=UPI002274A18F|nr:DUF3617 family protein [Sphingomonas sp.]MCX8476924.1 DUF3617 family protein [Sphingomonas sp.]
MALHRFRPAPMAPLLLALLIGACGKANAPANEAAASESVAAGTGFAGKLQPGLYDVVQTGDVEDHDKECITAEQLGKGEIASAESLQEGWRFVRNRMSGGRYEIEAAGPSNARLVSEGTYDSTSYQGTFVMNFEQDGKPQALRLKVKATRVADDCKDKDKDEG